MQSSERAALSITYEKQIFCPILRHHAAKQTQLWVYSNTLKMLQY